MKLFRPRHHRETGPGVQDTRHSSNSSSPGQVGPTFLETNPPSNFPDGIKVLCDRPDAVVDVCFIHGLTGDRERTWTADGQSIPWPKTLLPPKLYRARILTFGYDAYIVRKSVASSNRLIDHAINLLTDLTSDRDSSNASSRPLIFVAHSLGGLVCKKAILLSRNNPEVHLQGIFNSLKGVIFMGTPHKGAWMADWAKIPASALGFVKSTNTMLLDVLQRDSQLLESIQVDFLAMVRQVREEGRGLEVTCFFEELPVLGVGTIVSKESASFEGYAPRSIRANHRDMVKFATVEENGFKRLLGELTRWTSEVGQTPLILQRRNQYILNADDRACLRDLQTTNPRHDKYRIETDKGGLFKDAYSWILDHADFKRWRYEEESQLLWIKGDPGKGKTMLLCGIIDELTKSAPNTSTIAFFFCQATDARINHDTAVLRGLIFMLVDRQPSLISHIRRQYDKTGKQVFENVNAWEALSEIFTSILEDPQLQTTYLVIDALDECTIGRARLLDLVTQKSSAYPYVKWIVSSRNWPTIGETLDSATQNTKLSLELNEPSVTNAVAAFIHYKVQKLTEKKKYTNKLRDAVSQHLLTNARGTFLWVALVCEELSNVPKRNVRKKLEKFPSGLDELYKRMLDQINDSDDGELCKSLLAVITTVYRPITLDELASCIDLPEEVTDDSDIVEIIGLCGSFLTLRGATISLIHQSAKDFLLREAVHEIFPDGQDMVEYSIFSKSLQVIARALRRDIYNLVSPAYPIDQINQPDPDPLSAIRYSCIYWVDHLNGCSPSKNAIEDLQDSGSVDIFFRNDYLHWLEALSLSRSLSEGVASIITLESLLKEETRSTQLAARVRDACRFIRYHKGTIENCPLQVYASALIFSPVQSITRSQFEADEPPWITEKPPMEETWNACLLTIEDHSDSVHSVACSQDRMRLASASSDTTVRIWDAKTGRCISKLEGHSDSVYSIDWSQDGMRLASASHDKTIKIWDAETCQCTSTLEGHSDRVQSVAWSQDGVRLASGSHDKTVKIWDAAKGQCTSTIEGHSDRVQSVAWSQNSTQLASASGDSTIKIWDITTGQCISTLKGHSHCVQSVAWSQDSTQLASASSDNTVKIWDAETGQCTSTLKDYSNSVYSVAWSHDGKQLASGSGDDTVKIWDITICHCISTLKGHSDSVRSVAWLHNSTQIASTSHDNTIKIWDVTAGQCIATPEDHSNWVQSVTWSRDKTRLASASGDNTIKIWDTTAGQCMFTLQGHSSWVQSVAWSQDSTQLASASGDSTIKVWDIATGQCISTLKGHSNWVQSLAWSQDNMRLASTSSDNTIKIWDVMAVQCILTLKGHSNWVRSVAWSLDETRLASSSDDNTVKIWDTAIGECTSTLEGHGNWVRSVAWSQDETRLASSSDDNTVKIWDAATGKCILTLEIGRALLSLQFDQSNCCHLQSDLGTFDVSPSASATIPTPDSLNRLSSPPPIGYGLDTRGVWITYRGEGWLKLPLEYRASSSAFLPGMLAIGCFSGRVLFFSVS